MFGIDKSLEDFDNFTRSSTKPKGLDIIYYLFWDKGIDLVALNKLPLPYIFNIVKTFKYIKEEEIKEAKKASK